MKCLYSVNMQFKKKFRFTDAQIYTVVLFTADVASNRE